MTKKAVMVRIVLWSKGGENAGFQVAAGHTRAQAEGQNPLADHQQADDEKFTVGDGRQSGRSVRSALLVFSARSWRVAASAATAAMVTRA